MQKTTEQNGNFTIIALLVWAVVLVGVFLSSRGEDVGRLSSFLGGLTKGSLFGGEGLVASLTGLLIALLIVAAWYGLGAAVVWSVKRFTKEVSGENRSGWLDLARSCALGAAVWSLSWFFVGLAGGYNKISAVVSLLIGLGLAFFFALQARKNKGTSEKSTGDLAGNIAFGLILFVLAFTLVSAAAPPVAKDTLLYHFAVPKNFIAAGNNAVIEGNIASYLALGTEMHVVWAMLLGNYFSLRAGEVAASVTVFAFFPLLLLAIYGWARELELSKTWATIAALLVATIPTAYHVAANSYIDLALALYITLAIHAVGRWWRDSNNEWLFYAALCLGAALASKLTTLFAVIALGLVILLRARDAQNSETQGQNSNSLLLKGFAALAVAGILASPWYLKTWAATGSPVFPFYMNVWKGVAPGWDVERSVLFQIINSKYGNYLGNGLDYLVAPLTVSLFAQPEIPRTFDGVLGAAFLFGLPLIIWAYRRYGLRPELNVALIASGVLFLFWLFTSQQLRYLLPIFPALAVSICFSAHLISQENKAWRQALTGILIFIAAVSGSVSLAWFAQKNPLPVAFGGESREAYLTRRIDYYPYYQIVNNELPPDAKVWLINMRRDTYHIDKPHFSDYMFEDWTFKGLVEESKSVAELQNKIKQMGITHLLVRHDFLLDFKQTVLVDEQKRTEKENQEKLKMARDLILDNKNVIRSDNRFSLIKIN
jgi:preprotein translocase subunit SecG